MFGLTSKMGRTLGQPGPGDQLVASAGRTRTTSSVAKPSRPNISGEYPNPMAEWNSAPDSNQVGRSARSQESRRPTGRRPAAPRCCAASQRRRSALCPRRPRSSRRVGRRRRRAALGARASRAPRHPRSRARHSAEPAISGTRIRRGRPPLRSNPPSPPGRSRPPAPPSSSTMRRPPPRRSYSWRRSA